MTQIPQPLTAREEQLFPTLAPTQIDRIAARGRTRSLGLGEVLVAAGDPAIPFFVVRSGRIEVFRPTAAGEELVVVYGPGQFTGEASVLSGRRSIGTMRVVEPGEAIQLDRSEVLSLLQTDLELGTIILRAFILRRVELIAHGLGDVLLIGSIYCAGTLRVKEFLTRNGHPYSFVDLDEHEGVEALLEQFDISEQDIPVLIYRNGIVLRNPSNAEIADTLGFNEGIDATQFRDLVVVGAGPAGLAAAVYGASEGLDVLVLESGSPGGQAGSSSRIENYLGFPTGISGHELTERAFNQAQKFGAQLLVARGATALSCERMPYTIRLEDGTGIPARTIIIATGAEYRKPPCGELEQFEGAGVYYAATFMEAQICRGEEVVVIGGGNSAGQAAVFLSQSGSKVRMLVRSGGVSASMSRYLIRRIEGNPDIDLRTYTELAALDGDGHLERVTWRDVRTGETESHAIRHLFIMTGAEPNTRWLNGCLVVDERGFIKTGPDLSEEELKAAEWPLARAPHHLETSLPGVFAVGDVRSGNIKRVASAVGEGSIAVALVHQVLAE